MLHKGTIICKLTKLVKGLEIRLLSNLEITIYQYINQNMEYEIK